MRVCSEKVQNINRPPQSEKLSPFSITEGSALAWLFGTRVAWQRLNPCDKTENLQWFVSHHILGTSELLLIGYLGLP